MGLFFDCRWTSNADDTFFSDFCHIEYQVFQSKKQQNSFRRKYYDNLYGQSILVVVYDSDEPVAARALWRNDIEGREAYQPADTCVMENYRGKGIFSEMTRRSMELLPPNVIIYNFPNQYSYPGYLKMGWSLLHEYGFRLFTPKRYFKEHNVKMDNDYAQWWVMGNSHLSYLKLGDKYFLVKPDRRPLIKHIVACVEEDVAKAFPRSSFGLFFYPSKKETIYNRRYMKCHVICRNSDLRYIPIWKIDVL